MNGPKETKSERSRLTGEDGDQRPYTSVGAPLLSRAVGCHVGDERRLRKEVIQRRARRRGFLQSAAGQENVSHAARTGERCCSGASTDDNSGLTRRGSVAKKQTRKPA